MIIASGARVSPPAASCNSQPAFGPLDPGREKVRCCEWGHPRSVQRVRTPWCSSWFVTAVAAGGQCGAIGVKHWSREEEIAIGSRVRNDDVPGDLGSEVCRRLQDRTLHEGGGNVHCRRIICI